MSDGSIPKLHNILFTVKKNSDSNYKLLYVSSEIRQILKEGEKFFEESFFERIFPTLDKPLFEYLFEVLGKGDKIICPLVLNNSDFQYVQIEGYVISQEDNSYLINALVSPHAIENHVKYCWILDKGTNQVLTGRNQAFEIKDSISLISFIENRFKFLDRKKLKDFVENGDYQPLTIFPNHLFLTKETLTENYTLFQLEYFFAEDYSSKVQGSAILAEINPESLIYYDYNPKSGEMNWSGALANVLGYSNEYIDAISKKEWESLIHPDDRHLYQKGFEHSSTLTYKILHKEGHYVFVQDERKIFEKGKDQELLYLGVIKDISEIKEIEKDLLNNRSLLDQLTGVVPSMVFIIKTFPDLSHQYIFVSEGAYPLTGIPSNKIIENEKYFLATVHPDDVEKLKQADLKANQQDVKFQCYFRIITPSGEEKWIYGAANRLKQYKKEAIWAGFFVDVTSTKEKELESKQNLIKYKALFDENPLQIFQYDKDGIILDVNKKLMEEMGIPDTEAVVGKKLFDLLGDHPIKKVFMESIENGYGFYEGPHIGYFNQKPYHLRVNAKPMEEGKSFLAIMEDISEEEYIHNVLAQLTENTSKYSGQKFFDEITSFLSQKLQMEYCFIAEIDSNSITADVISFSKNGKMAPTFSYDLSDTPGLECLKTNTPLIIHQQADQKFPKSKQVIKNKISSYIGVPISDLENNRLGLLVLMDSKPLVTGSLSALFTVLADRIGAEMARTYFENELIASDQLFRSIAENFPKGTIEVLDKKLFYVYTEGKEYETTGVDPTKLIGTPHLSKYESYVSTEIRSYLDRVLKGDSVMFEVISGDQYYLKSGVPLYNNAGEIDRILLVTQNITETKVAEEEREQLIRDLKTQNEELQRFAYIISHNLRAPIVNISSLLELYNMEDAADPENQEIMENLKMATDILTGTLQDLIEVVSLKKNRVPKVETIDFASLCHNIERSLFKQIKESGTVFFKDFSQAPQIEYIYSHLENFLINLTTNAIKYKHPNRNPVINITTFKEKEYTVIKFQDNGIGIDLDRYGDRLFGLYQRFHSHVEGKGLGLYLVREQIRAHHGNLKVISKVNEGTTFFIYLKKQKANPEVNLIEKL